MTNSVKHISIVMSVLFAFVATLLTTSPAVAQNEEPALPEVRFVTTEGSFVLQLRPDVAPKTVENFLAYVNSGFYDGTIFHRVIPGFMVQGGDPTGTGKGGASVWGGTFGDEFHPDNAHNARGVLSMANKGPDTNRSQFFFTFAPQPHLNDKYSVFGHLVDGFETLDALEKLPVGKKHRPVTEVTIDRVTVHANPFAERDIVIRSPTGAVD